jgi:SRSO17 transposase
MKNMLSKNNPYNSKIPKIETMQKISSERITNLLNDYLEGYNDCFVRSQQIKYFTSFAKGLLSNLDRKSIEPIALSFLGEAAVRGMQDFFTRSKGWDESLSTHYKKQLAETLNSPQGFLSVDESDFVKKGKDSAGVTRQYCGRFGKTENCQAGVFLSYATDKGVGLIDSRLYLPKVWFNDEYKEKRENCQIPEGMRFKTKNEMAKEMISAVLDNQMFEVECIGCDAAFGSDHTFLDSLPESMHYFASVRENENIFRSMPQVIVPENLGNGGRFKHPRSLEKPVHIKTILDYDSIPWVRRIIAEGAKGPIIAEVKVLRCVSSRKPNRLYIPKSEIWVYIRKHEDGTIKYFISNMPDNTDISELDRLATARWSIEQCFQECKSYLGMTHYETRSYNAWHRHMLLVMIAHLFVTNLRLFFKKTCCCYDADDALHNCFLDSYSDYFRISFEDCALSFTA